MQVKETTIQSSTAMTVGTTYSSNPSSYLAINCTVAGNVAVTFPGGDIWTFQATVGHQILPYNVVAVNTSGTTATATYAKQS